MSDTTQNPGSDGIRDEVRLDLDEESIEKWDEVRDDYAVDTDAEVSRPALTESEDDDADDLPVSSEDNEEDTEAESDEGDLIAGRSDEEE
ncbi:hypothetical protein [Janibacter sp. HTCC2649]|uniref:hypothetical protein n=1 Tax=Janibacter sp. HTCC2649 TaxID=313589 RepID=UPI0002EF8ED6|nr:hypothetical protein [Janibacter sp. HTCC2649]